MRTRSSFLHCVSAAAALLLGCDGRGSLEPLAMPGMSLAVVSAPPVEAPSNPSAVVVTNTRIDVGWQDRSGNETGFEVHRSMTGASGTFSLLASVGAGAVTYGDDGLALATQYCYKVRAVRVLGNKTVYSAFTSSACVATPAPPPPPPSAAFITAALPLDSTTVRISWMDNSLNEDGFRVLRSTDGVSWAVVVAVRNVMTIDSGVPNAELGACYRVIAFNAGGDAPTSNTVCTSQPAAPTNLVRTRVDDQTADITWNDNSAVEDKYQVWAATYSSITCDASSSCEWPDSLTFSGLDGMIAELPASSTSFHCVGCTYGTQVWVIAFRNGVQSLESARVNATTRSPFRLSNDVPAESRPAPILNGNFPLRSRRRPR
jgi:hypothetical protein